MQIWLIQEGEKAGPFAHYEIRERLENGRLERGTPAWHEGLEAWKPLEDIPLFEDSLRRLERRSEPEAEPKVAPGQELLSPPPLPYRPGLIRRFWARWLDLTVYSALFWLGLWFAGRNIGDVLQNQWLVALQYVPWFVLETFLIHRFAATPGKAMLGIRVLNDDGSRLSLGQATRRSLLVLTIGIGLGISILALFCQGLAFFTARRIGRPVWDHLGGHKVAGRPLNGWGIAAAVMVFFMATRLHMAVVWPAMSPQLIETFPQFREEFENNPPWHLPERGR